jgi:hypothetical protein
LAEFLGFDVFNAGVAPGGFLSRGEEGLTTDGADFTDEEDH